MSAGGGLQPIDDLCLQAKPGIFMQTCLLDGLGERMTAMTISIPSFLAVLVIDPPQASTTPGPQGLVTLP